MVDTGFVGMIERGPGESFDEKKHGSSQAIDRCTLGCRPDGFETKRVAMQRRICTRSLRYCWKTWRQSA